MNDDVDFIWSMILLAMGIAAAFLLLSTAAVLAAPVGIVAACFVYWKYSPHRLEKLARKQTMTLYEVAKATYPEVVPLRATFAQFEYNGEPPEVYEPILAVGIDLWRLESFDLLIPEPPVMCNSIEGGRYRDQLNRLDLRQPALYRIGEMADRLTAYPYFEESACKEIIEAIVTRYDERSLFPITEKQMEANHQESDHLVDVLNGTVLERLKLYSKPFVLPDELRNEHHHIIAGIGHGKTQCIQSMIVNDLDTDASIVVIDSQSDMINTLAPRVDPDRLILIDPETCPPSLNLFAAQSDEKQLATAIELYEYIFSALEAEMTSKQQTAYRFVARLLMVVPGANIHTMREIFEPGTAHQEHLGKLDPLAQSYFETQFNSPQFVKETRAQILRRLYSLLESSTLTKMLGSSSTNLDIAKALDEGKVILISTAKNYLKETGASLFGRIFIAQIMQAVMDRGVDRRRTYLYLDEFQDYAEESKVFFSLFDQARKYNLGIIAVHQYLAQLPQKLQQSMATNTSIKFAGGVSPEDSTKLASQMRTTREFIDQQPKLHFAAYMRGVGSAVYPVEFRKLEKLPILEDIGSIQSRMRDHYSGQGEEVVDEPLEEGEGHDEDSEENETESPGDESQVFIDAEKGEW